MEAAAAVAAARRTNVVPFVAVDRQHSNIDDELNEAFTRRLQSRAFALGAEVERFEEEFADYCEVGHCVGVGSGAAALALALQGLGVGPGDEVVIPGHGPITAAAAVLHAGAEPVVCDVDEGTGLIDPDAARAAVGPRTAGIIASHLYGQMCDMDAIGAIAKAHGLLLLEDAGQAHGARYHGHRAGSISRAGAFSFYATTSLGVLGDGGAICTNDNVLAARLRRLRNAASTVDSAGEPADRVRLDDFQAALLRVKLTRLDQWNDARRRHAARYRTLLGDCVKLLQERPESPCVYSAFPARFDDRDAMSATLRAYNVGTAIHYYPAVHAHRTLKDHAVRHGELPVAEAWAAQELSLPMHPDLRADELERVARAVCSAAEVVAA